MPSLRDRIRYSAIIDRPRLVLPEGRRMAVWVVVNVEDWSIERPMPRTVLPPPMGQPLLPDLPNFAWHEYGMRVGFWRLAEVLARHGVRPTLAINGIVLETYPRVAEAALVAGWEFMGHGWSQRPMHAVDDQAAEIARTVEAIRRFTGKPPRGWESPGLTETDETIDHLAASGIEYVADWVMDDQPFEIATRHKPVVSIPYTVETNDITIYALQGHESDMLYDRGRAAFDRLHAESEAITRVMAISLHPYITGVAHRVGSLDRLLAHIRAHEDVALWTGEEILDWFLEAKGASTVPG